MIKEKLHTNVCVGGGAILSISRLLGQSGGNVNNTLSINNNKIKDYEFASFNTSNFS